LAQDPGSGLVFLDKPLVFNTKSSSQARDLFYTYDALAHFQAANIKREAGQEGAKTEDFVELQALGKAIALSYPKPTDHGKILDQAPAQAQSAVVLIDEIDKAPRDFPNDILNEIEEGKFTVKELNNREFKHHQEQRLVTILTSNSEKNLPDAFLRRCVFYHIPFPEKAQLMNIAKAQLGLPEQADAATENLLGQLLDYFEQVRKTAVRKPPATAELVAWLHLMGLPLEGKATDLEALRPQLLQNLSLLIKTREDLSVIQKWMKEGFESWLRGL
jgi:MoxR-like ATPase